MNPEIDSTTKTRIGVLVAFVCLPVYLAGASPLIFWRDSVEFSMIGRNLDIGHPAGSPLYAMFVKTLDLMPIGAAPFRSLIATILFAATAMFFLARLLMRVAEESGLGYPAAAAPALIGVFGFAFSPAFFDWTVAPEVYSGQLLAILIIADLAAGIHFQAKRGSAADRRLFWLSGFIMGLACGLHMGMVLLGPGLAGLLLATDKALRRPREILLFGFFLLVGFSIFIFLPVRSTTPLPFDQGNPEKWKFFLMHITGQRYSGIIHSFPWPRIGYDLKALASHFPDQLTWPVVAFAVAGLAALVRSAPALLPGLALLVLGHLYLYVKDWHDAFGYIPLFAVAAVLAGIGFIALLRVLPRFSARSPRLPLAAAAILIGLVFAFQSHRALAMHSRADHDLAHRHARALMDSLPQESIYLSYQDANSYTAFYTQSVERYREDVVHIQRAFLPHTEYLRSRYPSLDFSGYRPDEPWGIYHWLAGQQSDHEAFWDYGWEETEILPKGGFVPSGFVYRVVPIGEAPRHSDETRFRRYFGAVSARVHDFPFDFTVREVYARYFSLLAKYYFDRGEIAVSESAVREALSIRPDFGQNYTQFAVVTAATGKKEEAWKLSVEATKLEPYQADNWNYRARFAMSLKNVSDAIFSYEKSLALNRYQSGVAASVAEMLFIKSDYREAWRRSRDALRGARNPADRVRAGKALAGAYFGMGRFRAADRALDDVLGEAPNDAVALNLKRLCRAKMNGEEQ